MTAMIEERELEHLRTWVGREERAEDVITLELVRRFRAVFDEPPGEPEAGADAPLGIHWCLAPAVAPMSALGRDGHPARGGFLPPAPLPRRMWAGGELAFVTPLLVGDRVERLSRIVDVAAKNGRNGPLCFVKVEHQYRTERGLALTERQDIVYRGEETGAPAPPGPSAPAQPPTAGPPWRQSFLACPVLLFRYSALTFNGHRIHYDRSYAENEEGYANLVVHGPLQATALLRLAAAILNRPPAQFTFRGLSPLTLGQAAWLNAVEANDSLALWIDHEGRHTMLANTESAPASDRHQGDGRPVTR